MEPAAAVHARRQAQWQTEADRRRGSTVVETFAERKVHVEGGEAEERGEGGGQTSKEGEEEGAGRDHRDRRELLRFHGGAGEKDAAEEEGEEEGDAGETAARGKWGRSEEERLRKVGQEEGWQKVEKMYVKYFYDDWNF